MILFINTIKLHIGIWIIFLLYVFLVAQLCLPFCNPMDYSQPDSSVHGIFQARILEWVAISFSNIIMLIAVLTCFNNTRNIKKTFTKIYSLIQTHICNILSLKDYSLIFIICVNAFLWCMYTHLAAPEWHDSWVSGCPPALLNKMGCFICKSLNCILN